MKNKIFLLLFPLLLKASIIDDYLKGNYSQICNINNVISTKNEKILSIIGTSCVKSDKLYLLSLIINKLKDTPIGRKNSIYFSIIFTQKKLLYAFLFDNYSLKNFNFPKTDYILSDVFESIKNKKFILKGDIYIINLKNKTIYFYKQGDRMYIDEYKDEKLIKRHWFR